MLQQGEGTVGLVAGRLLLVLSVSSKSKSNKRSEDNWPFDGISEMK